MKQIFPQEIIENTIESLHFKHSTKSKVIYTIILFVMLTAIGSLPFINVTLYNTSQGLICSDKERILLQNVINGEVIFEHLKNNETVYKGDTILIINNTAIVQKTKVNTSQIKETKRFISDLKVLLKNGSTEKIQSLKFKKEFLVYTRNLEALESRYKKSKIDYKRNQQLYAKGVIAKTTFENIELTYKLAINALDQQKVQQQNN